MNDKQYTVVNGTSYDARTDKEVIRLLEHYRQTGKRVRVYYGTPETGLCWLEEYDTIGRIGRSTGSSKIPLLLRSSRSTGGGGLLDYCIIRIQDVRSKQDCWRHPKFNLPKLAIQRGNHSDYPVEVTTDGEVHARFKTQDQAERWVAFMQGERMAK